MKRFLVPVALTIAVLLALALAQVVEQRALRPRPDRSPGLPQVSPPPGRYRETTLVVLQASDPRSQIVFTTDGTFPTATVGTLYEVPVRLDAAFPGVTTIRAVEVLDGVTGPLLHAAYLIGLDPAVPVVSISAEPADLWDADRGLFVNTSWRGAAWERPVHITGFFDEEVPFSAPAGMRIDGREPWTSEKQSLRIYFREPYGVGRVTAPLFPRHLHQPARDQIYKRLLLQAGGQEPRWTLLRDHLATEAARAMGFPFVEGRFVWLFVNDTSWGIYRLTERVDRFFLEDNLNITSADVVREGDAREGTDVAWEALVDYMASADMSVNEHFDYVSARVDLDNFVDAVILYEYFEFPAETLVAVHPDGGRWFWVLEGTGKPETGESDFVVLFRALMGNHEFERRFRRRLAEALNTSLAPQSLRAYLNEDVEALSPAFKQERARWPGVSTWEELLAGYMMWSDSRPSSLIDHWIGSTVTLTMSVAPEDGGRIYVEGYSVVDADVSGGEPWHGRYPAGEELRVIAVPASGYEFGGWRTSGGEALRSESGALTVTLDEPRTLTALFSRPSKLDGEGEGRHARVAPDDVVINELWINDDGTQYPSLDYRSIEGDWIELLVRCPGSKDLRGWRLTDNDTKSGTLEGSLIFPELDALAEVPCGTVVLIVATESDANAEAFPADDLDAQDGLLTFYVGRGHLDGDTDPGFGLGTGDENVVLLAPGASSAFEDDIGVDFVAEGSDVTPYTFGVLSDGVTFDTPFRYIGDDDGAVLQRPTVGNDDIARWHVDPTACESYDARCLGAAHLVTPGALNPGQEFYRWQCRFSPASCRAGSR